MGQMPVILGPTACGKTAVAARLAFEIGGEVISADSRQVYKSMDIGSGKDLGDYIVEGNPVPYHLIDIAEPGSEYNIFQYQKDFTLACDDIISRGKVPVLCGGSGMYLEAVLKGYSLPEAPPDPEFASSMESKTDSELLQELSRVKKLHSTTDTLDRGRMLRALEIELKRKQDARYKIQDKSSVISDHASRIIPPALCLPHPASRILHPASCLPHPESRIMHPASCIPHPESRIMNPASPILFGLNPGREIVRHRITDRLRARLNNGMVEEVRVLLDKGIPPDRLKAYGLEYKFITQYLEGELSFEEMFRLLNIAIHQFAKRQMTWFRRMEKQGMLIHWIEGEKTMEEKVREIRVIGGW